MNHFIIDGRYEDLLRYFELDPAAVLKKAQLPEDIFRHRTITMKEEEYYRFLDAVSQLSEDPELPVKVATQNQIESFSPPIFAWKPPMTVPGAAETGKSALKGLSDIRS